MSSPAPLGCPARRDDGTAIAAVDLRRTYRKREGWRRSREVVEAVRGISFDVPRGTVFGILGPNGAGKTTTIKMLSTLLLPTSGRASIDGFDVVRDEVDVRRRLGVLFGGDKGLYDQLSGRENLRYFAHLYGVPRERIAARCGELLERVGLADRSKERVESYSRGMKQRLHIAKTLVHRPPVVILDEPTIGLDPAAALDVRSLIEELVPQHTVMLSTHDMFEADRLCQRLAIVDRGSLVAEGSPTELKAAAPVDRQVRVTVAGPLGDAATQVLADLGSAPSVLDITHERGADDALVVRCVDTSLALDRTLESLHRHRTSVLRLEVREPTLEDAFLGVTGRTFESDDVAEAAA